MVPYERFMSRPIGEHVMIRLSLVALFLFAAPLAAQEAEKPAKSDPAALSLFERAVAHQAPKQLTGPDAIRDLLVRIQAEVWDYRGEKPEKQSITVSRYLASGPDRFRSEWRTLANTLVNGFDGRFFWFAEYDVHGAKQDARLLVGDQYKSDKQRIRDEMEETRYLIRFFFLGNLKGDGIVLTKKPDETIDAFGKRECEVLHRVNPDADTAEPPLSLYIEKKTLRLVRAVAHATKKRQKSLRFTFRYDEAVQPRVKGVLFPFKMELHEKPSEAKEYRIVSRATLLENGIDFNGGLKKTLFKAPIKKKPADEKAADEKAGEKKPASSGEKKKPSSPEVVAPDRPK
jgi:hypothetical protein